MSHTRIRTREATDQLQEDHRRIWKLFKQYGDLEETDHASKFELFGRIKEAITAHADREEAVFYPALDGLEREGVQEQVSEAHEAHEIIKLLLEQLSHMTPEDLYFDAKVKVLAENVERHVSEEELELFPLFRMLDQDIQDRVAERLRAPGEF